MEQRADRRLGALPQPAPERLVERVRVGRLRAVRASESAPRARTSARARRRQTHTHTRPRARATRQNLTQNRARGHLLARWAQKRGLILTPREHGLHHRAPFDQRYCILTGACNAALDAGRVFRRLEYAVWRATGAEPNCWKLDPQLREETIRSGFGRRCNRPSS